MTGEELAALFDEVSGLKLKPFFDRYVRGTDDLPLARLLAPFGIALEDGRGNGNGKPSLGARTARDGNDCKLASVYEGEAAHMAGLSAGDVLVAIDGLRVTASNLDTLLGRYRAGDAVTVHAFRRDELFAAGLVLAADAAPKKALALRDKPAAAARLRGAWLEGRKG